MWFVAWLGFVALSIVVWFFYRVTNRTFAIWGIASLFVFFVVNTVLETFPDLRRVLPRIVYDRQFRLATEISPGAVAARKRVEQECRDEEAAETLRLTRDLDKYQSLRTKNGSLTPEEEKGREQALNRLSEIEKKMETCVARVLPPKPRADSPPVSVPQAEVPVAPRRSNAAPPTPTPPERTRGEAWQPPPKREEPKGAVRVESIVDRTSEEPKGAARVESIPAPSAVSR